MKTKIALVRGKFLNKFELQFYEPLIKEYDLLGIGSLTCFHNNFRFPIIKLVSPVDLPDFPFKMPILNRLTIDANYLFGLEDKLKGFDIAHSAETYYHYTIQCLNAKNKGLVKKVVVSIFENIPFAGESIWGRKNFKKRVIIEADHLIAVSKKTREALISEGCRAEKISIITQHIDTNRFYPKKKINKSNKLTILFTGRLEFYKGVFDFVKAAFLVLKDGDFEDYHLTFKMVGQGSCSQKLINLEKQLGIEKYFIHENYSYESMPKAYQEADVYIAPSRKTKHWQEQFSTVLLEAKASGLPIISTNTGGISENVGQAGILVPDGDFYQIADNLKRFILDPKKRIYYGNLARKDALARFTLEKGVALISSIYKKVLNN